MAPEAPAKKIRRREVVVIPLTLRADWLRALIHFHNGLMGQSKRHAQADGALRAMAVPVLDGVGEGFAGGDEHLQRLIGVHAGPGATTCAGNSRSALRAGSGVVIP